MPVQRRPRLALRLFLKGALYRVSLPFHGILDLREKNKLRIILPFAALEKR